MNRFASRIVRLAPPTILALCLAACGKSNDTAPAAPEAAAPGLADLKNPEVMAKVAASTLPKGDPATPVSAYRKIDSGHQVMFLYYALANMPVPYEDIAQAYSDDYSRTSDSFKRNDIIKALQPRIDQEIANAKAGRYVMLEQQDSSLLQRYNFEKKSFAIDEFASDDRYRYFNDNSKYTLTNTNNSQFTAFPVPDEASARKIEGYLSKYAQLRMQTYAFVQDVDPSNRRVKLQVMKVRLLDPSGELLTEL
ncbi:DUF4852 domain-containing protein [Massilia arenae]|uniref:DUF4852 domain-containing protein n=1 Tax=Massilia arenae TaxID=2603288 RepID=A0A5C7G7F2_9BURK|nr:DUF4852 domain-containing protein [Massilia arenae]TXG01941.1 DUF4852 domain-containing protein [Massilia arenae]